MKRITTILTLVIFTACSTGIGFEEVVRVELPSPKNLVTIEGWVTSSTEIQYVRLTRSNSFNNTITVDPITDASIIVQARNGQTHLYSHSNEGVYLSNEAFAGITGTDYRVRVQLQGDTEIRSDWETMPEVVALNRLFVDSFEENDPNDPTEQIDIYFPRILAVDPEGSRNYYRYRFFKNDEVFTESESITIQDDRFFDGNLIPNNFRSFGYAVGDLMVVQFQSINANAFNYLSLLKSQITSLGTSSGTTPAQVIGNLSYVSSEIDEDVLGYFGLVGVSSDTTIVVE